MQSVAPELNLTFSLNLTALKNYKGEYILNGDWTINRPGKYKLNGHYAVYERSNKEHSLKIDGPIDAPLTIEVYLKPFHSKIS